MALRSRMRDALIECWIDSERLVLPARCRYREIQTKLASAIVSAAGLLVIESAASRASHWVQFEIRIARQYGLPLLRLTPDALGALELSVMRSVLPAHLTDAGSGGSDELWSDELLIGLDDDGIYDRHEQLRRRLFEALGAAADDAEAGDDIETALRLTRRRAVLEPFAEKSSASSFAASLMPATAPLPSSRTTGWSGGCASSYKPCSRPPRASSPRPWARACP